MASHPRPPVDKDRLRRALDLSHFDINAVIRGAQLTLVGASRALQNPKIFTSDHYRQAAIAVAAGIAIRLLIVFPESMKSGHSINRDQIYGIRLVLWLLSIIVRLDHVTWDNKVIDGLTFLEEHVLQVPLFLMSMMRHYTSTLDSLFMDSLAWVDATYMQKHEGEDPGKLRPLYHANLVEYPVKPGSSTSYGRFLRKAATSLVVYMASYLPVLGRLVLPAASFYTFNKAVGLGPASVIFGTSIFLPRRYLVVFLQTYFASRSLVRELLDPYFARVQFTAEEKRKWFRSREGLLFGFGIGFLALLRVPLLGVLIYGIAEASTAYLITKISDPPPLPSQSQGFAASQRDWKNKHEFLSLSLNNLDSDSRAPPKYELNDPYAQPSISGSSVVR